MTVLQIIIMEFVKRLKALNKHSITHIMYIEMEEVCRRTTRGGVGLQKNQMWWGWFCRRTSCVMVGFAEEPVVVGLVCGRTSCGRFGLQKNQLW